MLRRAVLPLLVLLASAAPASAATYTIGSDLQAPATTPDSNGMDWAAFNVGSAYVAKAQGEISSVTIRGTVDKSGMTAPFFQIHVIVLRPVAAGGYKVVTASDSLPIPFGVDPGTLTTWNLQANKDVKVCVVPGDIVALSPNGGGGVPVQVFNRGGTGTMGLFKLGRDRIVGGTYIANGTTLYPQSVQGEELLLRATIGTAADARYFCRTPAEQAANLDNPKPPKDPSDPTSPTTPAAGSGTARIAVPKKAIKLNKVVRFKVSCPTTASCAGSIKLRGPITVTKSFTMRKGNTKTIAVTLTKKAVKTLKRRKKLKVKVTLLRADGSKQRFSVKLKRA